jgi:tetratricopeptide (TPR) repeat protein
MSSENDDPKGPPHEPELAGEDGKEDREALPTEPIVIEIDRQLERLDQVLEKVRGEVTYWAKKGVYTKVRFKFRGKPLLPDLPMAAFLAAEAATFWYTGLLRALVMNVGGRTLFDIELISDAEPHLARGQEHLLDGDVDEALEEFHRALAIDRNLASAHLNVGICKKLKGDKETARESFRQARDLDPHGEVGRQATAQLRKLG